MTSSVRTSLSNERGIGLVSALLIISLLAILSAVIAVVAVNERRSAFNEVLHSGSLIAADSGTEQAISWLKGQDDIPMVDNLATLQVNAQTLSKLATHSNQRFEYEMNVALNAAGNPDFGPPPGYDANQFLRVNYDVISSGEAGLSGHSNVAIIVAKVFTSGY